MSLCGCCRCPFAVQKEDREDEDAEEEEERKKARKLLQNQSINQSILKESKCKSERKNYKCAGKKC